jgi:hypothetical protein
MLLLYIKQCSLEIQANHAQGCVHDSRNQKPEEAGRTLQKKRGWLTL